MGSNQTVAGLKLNGQRMTGQGDIWFKSDRCGIETFFRRFRCRRFIKFKSDRCGIETRMQGRSCYGSRMFKSDRCGIETWCWNGYEIGCCGSNQTVAGLKHNKRSQRARQVHRSNQTVAGLKHRYCAWNHIVYEVFKSDRCGIETFVSLLFADRLCWVQIRPLRD